MLSTAPLVLALFVLAMTAVAAVTDLRTGLIPNALTLGGLAALFVAQLLSAGLTTGAVTALSGLALAAFVPLLLYLAGGLGGGDLKLLAACGVGLGPWLAMEAQLLAFGAGCLYAVGRAIWDGILWQTLRGTARVLTRALTAAEPSGKVSEHMPEPVRFAPFIFFGTLLSVIGVLT